jgi:restriction system protein
MPVKMGLKYAFTKIRWADAAITAIAAGQPGTFTPGCDRLCFRSLQSFAGRARTNATIRPSTCDREPSRLGTNIPQKSRASYPRRGYMRILERGKKVLEQNPKTLTVKDLKQWPEFEKNWKTGAQKKHDKNEVEETDDDSTPEEQMEYAFDRLSGSLESDILEQVKSCSPHFFEKLVVHLLLRMGYGGSLKDAGEAIGRSGDGGIDGIIKEDKLGLDVIYIQAKRWENTVGRPDIQKFAGALQGNRAKKGVFITTSNFSKEAIDFAKGLDSKLILIDGERLAELMVEHDIGVSPVVSYTVKRIDSDYFSEE